MPSDLLPRSESQRIADEVAGESHSISLICPEVLPYVLKQRLTLIIEQLQDVRAVLMGELRVEEER